MAVCGTTLIAAWVRVDWAVGGGCPKRTTTLPRAKVKTRGGKRKGAGRPSNISLALAEERQGIVLSKLQVGFLRGRQELADKYPALMSTAIEVALGVRDEENGQWVVPPSITMLRSLTDLLPRIVGDAGSSGESPVDSIIRELRGRVVNLSQTNIYAQPSVGGDSKVSAVEAGYTVEPRVGASVLQPSEQDTGDGR